MRPTTRAAAVAVVALVLAAVLVATGTSAQGRAQLDQVKYATSFGTFGRDSFVYVAIEKGFFREQNLEVSVVPGLGTDNARLLASGQIDYSGSEITGNMIGRIVAGFPVKIVAVTSQSTQAAIATLAESGIANPQALEGKTLADLPASIVIRLFPLFAKRAGRSRWCGGSELVLIVHTTWRPRRRAVVTAPAMRGTTSAHGVTSNPKRAK